MSATITEIGLFLQDFKFKSKIFDIFYIDERRKNTQTLLDLELPANIRDKIIFNLDVENYSEGPIPDLMGTYSMGDLWVFGALYKKKYEIYIKIQMGIPNSSTICISFHLAEHPMTYPFRI